LALNEAFDNIDKNDFSELTERYRNAQGRKKRNFAKANRHFSITGSPPKKTSIAQSSRDTHSSYSSDDGNGESAAPRNGRGGGVGSSFGDTREFLKVFDSD
jgi:hypothetical protein